MGRSVSADARSSDTRTDQPAAGSPVDAARALAGVIRARSDDIERERRLPMDLVRAISDAGLFRLCVPQRFGGREVDVTTLVGAIEEVARADGSAGWCVMIGANSGIVSAYLPDAVAQEIYGPARSITGGAFAPSGRATVTDDGYRVSGRWAFASGCEHCHWLMGGCVIDENGSIRRLPNGIPDARMMLFPASEVRIIDTWSVAGLQGTGSHDFVVADALVPAERSVSIVTDQPKQPGTLYVFPVFGLLALGIAGVALGIARSAIDALTELAREKTPAGSRRRLAERSVIQAEVAHAEATLRSARALVYETVGETWDRVHASGTISIEQRTLVRLAATHAVSAAASAVDRMYNAGGGTAVYGTSPLQRHFRDIHVVTQHMMVGGSTYELAGRLLLGLDTDTSML